MTDFGRLYDGGDSRDGSGCVNVTGSHNDDVVAAKKWIREVLADGTVPIVEPKKKKSQS